MAPQALTVVLKVMMFMLKVIVSFHTDPVPQALIALWKVIVSASHALIVVRKVIVSTSQALIAV